MMDGEMDRVPAGPLHLKEERCAQVVENAILFGAGSRYDLLAWCVMANHVHVLLKPLGDFHRIMQGIKGYCAYRVNQLLKASGSAFWLDESYDHWPRDDEELFRIIQYVEANPVAAGLCRSPEDCRWSSGARRSNWRVGTPFVPDVLSIGRGS
jgi:REP element-mobilizing transposase RayT